jgi:hypothetical protein
MKNKYFYMVLSAAALMGFTSCDNYLDVTPDNRTELDNKTKIEKILTSAYPLNTCTYVKEMSSDNADDSGTKYSFADIFQQDSYLWKDHLGTENDSEYNFWSGCYTAITSANAAIEGIDKLGNPSSLSAERAEALLCRAYAHFALANVFCNAWSAKSGTTDLGIPYVKATEKTVNPKYERGTLDEVYKNIDADIQEALPLVSDEYYSVPKYHFNVKAAYAFAARFYLYYHQWEKVVEYASKVVGSDPSVVVRDWATIGALSKNGNIQPNAFIDSNNKANLLIMTADSSWGVQGGAYISGLRYSHTPNIATQETCWSAGPWGDGSKVCRIGTFSNSNSMPTRVIVRKLGAYFEYTDAVAGIGYYHIVQPIFTTDETLLCRAEAYTMLKQYDKALADMNIWEAAYTTKTSGETLDDINNFYGNMAYYKPSPIMSSTPKKALNPVDFTVETGTQENMLQYILHARRILTLHEGLRWEDVKRWGIVIYRRSDLDTGVEITDELKVNDPRRAIQIPSDVITAGLPANPRN